jgi:hypothetical protein
MPIGPRPSLVGVYMPDDSTPGGVYHIWCSTRDPPCPLPIWASYRSHPQAAREFPQKKGRPIEPGRGVMDESRSLTRKEPMDVLVYRTRVPADLWYNVHERAALLARLKSADRYPIGYDESLLGDGIILLISVGLGDHRLGFQQRPAMMSAIPTSTPRPCL